MISADGLPKDSASMTWHEFIKIVKESKFIPKFIAQMLYRCAYSTWETYHSWHLIFVVLEVVLIALGLGVFIGDVKRGPSSSNDVTLYDYAKIIVFFMLLLVLFCRAIVEIRRRMLGYSLIYLKFKMHWKEKQGDSANKNWLRDRLTKRATSIEKMNMGSDLSDRKNHLTETISDFARISSCRFSGKTLLDHDDAWKRRKYEHIKRWADNSPDVIAKINFSDSHRNYYSVAVPISAENWMKISTGRMAPDLADIEHVPSDYGTERGMASGGVSSTINVLTYMPVFETDNLEIKVRERRGEHGIYMIISTISHIACYLALRFGPDTSKWNCRILCEAVNSRHHFLLVSIGFQPVIEQAWDGKLRYAKSTEGLDLLEFALGKNSKDSASESNVNAQVAINLFEKIAENKIFLDCVLRLKKDCAPIKIHNKEKIPI